MERKVLLVEDNENNRYLAQFLLEKGGFVVVQASNGRQALEMVRREMPALIVMDIQMPEMDGYETATRIKNDPELAHIPIVGVSSFAGDGDRQRALRAGFAGYIEKPINSETFAAQVASHIQPQGPAHEDPDRR